MYPMFSYILNRLPPVSWPNIRIGPNSYSPLVRPRARAPSPLEIGIFIQPPNAMLNQCLLGSIRLNFVPKEKSPEPFEEARYPNTGLFDESKPWKSSSPKNGRSG